MTNAVCADEITIRVWDDGHKELVAKDSIEFEAKDGKIGSKNVTYIPKDKAQKLLEVVNFYANPENWSRRDTVFWESIDRADCKDYPHITRDLRLTGGHKARQLLKELSNEK